MGIFVTKFSQRLLQKMNTVKARKILHFRKHMLNLSQFWIEHMFLVFPLFKSICKVCFLRELGSVTNGKIIKIVEVISWVFLTQI